MEGTLKTSTNVHVNANTRRALADHRRRRRAIRAGPIRPALLRCHGLISSVRTDGGQRRYHRDVLRLLAVIRSAKHVGFSLAEIAEMLAAFPDDHALTEADWRRLSTSWRPEIDERIRTLERIRDQLDRCIGCGCLSMKSCQMANPADRAGRRAPGPASGWHRPEPRRRSPSPTAPSGVGRYVPADAHPGARCRVRWSGADDPAVRRVRRRRRRRADRPERRLRVRVLEARRHVRARRRRRGRATPTATSSSRACGSCRRRCGRSIRPPGASRPTPGPSTPTSWWSRSAPTCIPTATPGLRRGRPRVLHGRRRLRAARRAGRLRRRPGDRRRHLDAVQVPAGPERDRAADARLPHASGVCRDASEISLVMPLGVPIPPSPAASEALLAAFAERGIELAPRAAGARARPGPQGRPAQRRRRDALRPVPRRARCTGRPTVVEESGLTVDGWIPVDPLTLETSFPGVYAVGDVTSVGTPKAGVFAEGQAVVVADAIIAPIRGAARAPHVRRPRASATSSSATTRSPRSTSPS